jgi:protein-tyrosine phosphatase
MRQIPNHQLWIGNAGDLRDTRVLLMAGIEAVIEVADSEPLALLPRELIRLRFPLSDGGSNPAWLLRLAANSLAALVREKVPTLVCCSAGLSRSVCVAAAGLSITFGRPLHESLEQVAATGPSDVAPELWAQFQQGLASPGLG